MDDLDTLMEVVQTNNKSCPDALLSVYAGNWWSQLSVNVEPALATDDVFWLWEAQRKHMPVNLEPVTLLHLENLSKSKLAHTQQMTSDTLVALNMDLDSTRTQLTYITHTMMNTESLVKDLKQLKVKLKKKQVWDHRIAHKKAVKGPWVEDVDT
ncbi:hypothetical protein H1R20_g15566, partial [Candolleomyces eurysporus]